MLNNRTTKHGYGKARLVTTARNMYLIKVCNDLIEYAQTLHSLVIGGEFRVELGEVRDWGEHDTDLAVMLAIQLLKNDSQSVLSYVVRF